MLNRAKVSWRPFIPRWRRRRNCPEKTAQVVCLCIGIPNVLEKALNFIFVIRTWSLLFLRRYHSFYKRHEDVASATIRRLFKRINLNRFYAFFSQQNGNLIRKSFFYTNVIYAPVIRLWSNITFLSIFICITVSFKQSIRINAKKKITLNVSTTVKNIGIHLIFFFISMQNNVLFFFLSLTAIINHTSFEKRL